MKGLTFFFLILFCMGLTTYNFTISNPNLTKIHRDIDASTNLTDKSLSYCNYNSGTKILSCYFTNVLSASNLARFTVLVNASSNFNYNILSKDAILDDLWESVTSSTQLIRMITSPFFSSFCTVLEDYSYDSARYLLGISLELGYILTNDYNLINSKLP